MPLESYCDFCRATLNLGSRLAQTDTQLRFCRVADGHAIDNRQNPSSASDVAAVFLFGAAYDYRMPFHVYDLYEIIYGLTPCEQHIVTLIHLLFAPYISVIEVDQMQHV